MTKCALKGISQDALKNHIFVSNIHYLAVTYLISMLFKNNNLGLTVMMEPYEEVVLIDPQKYNIVSKIYLILILPNKT